MKSSRLGFMQGRLSPFSKGVIQEFPWNYWQKEFSIAQDLGFTLIEWTLDKKRLLENPLMTKNGQKTIKDLCKNHQIEIPSLTGDCFMQSPFWKLFGQNKKKRQQELQLIVIACSNLNIEKIVIPLVDNGTIESEDQSDALLDFLNQKENFFEENNVSILFESDFSPARLKAFINKLNPEIFGINYDTGNSASLGYKAEEEFKSYGDRIYNVHIKDRVLNGTTVPLGQGNADFNKIFKALKKINYKGNFILQTARAEDGNHSLVLEKYKSMIEKWEIDFGL